MSSVHSRGKSGWQRELAVKKPKDRNMLGFIKEQQGGQCDRGRVKRVGIVLDELVDGAGHRGVCGPL